MYNGEYIGINSNCPRNFMHEDNIYILDEITNENTAHLIADLSTYIGKKENCDKIVKIFINSPGGEADVCFGLIGLMNLGRLAGIKFYTFIIGCAASAASLIACAGDKRMMSEFSTHMVHFGQYWQRITKTSEIEKAHINIARWSDKIKTHYLRCCAGKLSEKQFQKIIEDEQGYLSADDCLKYGFVDSVVEYDLQELDDKLAKDEEEHKEFKQWKNEQKKKVAKNDK